MYGNVLLRLKRARNENSRLKKKRNNTADEENKFYEEQKVCKICKKGFSIDNDKKSHKVRDLCHYTGNFRGAAHSIRSLDTKHQKKFQ